MRKHAECQKSVSHMRGGCIEPCAEVEQQRFVGITLAHGGRECQQRATRSRVCFHVAQTKHEAVESSMRSRINLRFHHPGNPVRSIAIHLPHLPIHHMRDGWH